MSRAASLPGAELFFQKFDCLGKEPLVPGSFAARGRTFSRNFTFWGSRTCRGQLRCLGQICFMNFDFFFGRHHLSPAASLPGAFFQKFDFWGKEPLAPGSFAAWGRLFPEKLVFGERATGPGQLRCLGQNFFQKFHFGGKKPLVPGNFAAWRNLFSRNLTFGGKNHLSRAASLPGADFFP